MLERRSIKLPIILGTTLIVLIVALIVGWVLLTVFGANSEGNNPYFYWTLLSVGSAVFGVVLVGVILYLALSVKAINLSRRQSNFIDSVTHELKSPIASLKLCLQTMDRRHLDADERHKFRELMLEDVDRLDQLISHLLDAGRLHKRPVDQEVVDVELSEVLRDCAQTVCVRYYVAPAAIQMQLEPCIVRARVVDVQVMFRNLIDNAVKYAGDPPEVRIELSMESQERAVVRIIDNGRGIPPKQRRRIFGRFVRLGLELEREKPGTGLGLSIVWVMVRRLRGKIQVRDAESGEGTVFEVQLPATPVQSQRALDESSAEVA